MPAIRSVLCQSGSFVVADQGGVSRIVTTAMIPGPDNTPALVATWINTVWVPANITGCQLIVHVFTIAPLTVAVWTGNIGVTPPSGSWWAK
jgi:hypothetical protein